MHAKFLFTVAQKSPDELLIQEADELYKENDILKLYKLLIQHKVLPWHESDASIDFCFKWVV